MGVLVSSGALPGLGSTQTAPTPLASVALTKLEYWHKNHLGSLAATTDHTGAVTARYAYDPFGKRRFTQGTYDAAGTLVIDWSNAVNGGTDRGFTGHEHLDDIGLIHMNGRIYDPALGRFLSADPHVAAAFDLQSYDRYAYVLNNPLASTDPTGFNPNREPWLNDHWFDATLPPVVITGSKWQDAYYAQGIFTTRDLLLAAGFSANAQGGLRTGPFFALGAAPGTPAQQSMGGLITAAKEQMESAARGAKALAGALGKDVAENSAAPVLARLVGAMMAEAAGEEAAGEGLKTDGASGGANSSGPKEPDPASGEELDSADKKGELTKAGRAQQKHGDRTGSAFDPAKGTPADKNAQGQQTLDSITNSPSRTSELNQRGGTDVRESPNGRGARFDQNGKFTGFIEPRRP